MNLATILSRPQIEFLEKFGFYVDICATPEPIRRQWSQGTVKLDEGRGAKGFPHLRSTAQARGLELVFRKAENVDRAGSSDETRG